VPTGVELIVLIASAEVPAPLTDKGEKAQLAPFGSPPHVSAIVPLNPLMAMKVIVEFAELPGATIAGKNVFAAIRKSGAGVCPILKMVTIPDKIPDTSVTTSGRPSLLESAMRINCPEEYVPSLAPEGKIVMALQNVPSPFPSRYSTGETRSSFPSPFRSAKTPCHQSHRRTTLGDLCKSC
jgi:hypothetical protein